MPNTSKLGFTKQPYFMKPATDVSNYNPDDTKVQVKDASSNGNNNGGGQYTKASTVTATK